MIFCFLIVIYLTQRVNCFIPSNNKFNRISTIITRQGIQKNMNLYSNEVSFSDGALKTIENSNESLRRSDPVKLLIQNQSLEKAYSDQSIQEVVSQMNRSNRGGILIFNRLNNQLAGIFTERDYITKTQDMNLPPNLFTVSEVMTPYQKLVKAYDYYSIGECRRIMVSNKLRRLPILNKDNEPVGLVSMAQIDRVVFRQDAALDDAKLFGNTLEQVQEQSKSLANLQALESGDAGSFQDNIRGGFVFVSAAVGALILQGDWVHNHEWLSMSLTFLLGYIGIVFETYFEFNKSGIALLMCTALWVIYAGTAGATGITEPLGIKALGEKVSEVSEVVFFLLGAMTIVEIVDSHQGFKVITDKIKSSDKKVLMWLIGGLTFFMSAILDNLTTTIVMVSLIKKILPDVMDRKVFGSLIVIAANAGGAWTPIGDVTTTMLWINGQISALPTITNLFFPSLVSIIISIFMLQRDIPNDSKIKENENYTVQQLAPRGQLVFGTGIACLLSVPVFKALTGLPPYLGMLAALGVMWTLTDAIHAGEEDRENLMAPAALRKIDTSGVLFFLGILLSVGALDSAGILQSIAGFLDQNIPDRSIIATIIGLVSALIDNVPLVAATMGMYPISSVPMDSSLWQLIAFCAGTGGSLLIIGSAAGVALMGLEKVDFIWYIKNISLSALFGYLGGIGVYLLQRNVIEMIM